MRGEISAMAFSPTSSTLRLVIVKIPSGIVASWHCRSLSSVTPAALKKPSIGGEPERSSSDDPPPLALVAPHPISFKCAFGCRRSRRRSLSCLRILVRAVGVQRPAHNDQWMSQGVLLAGCRPIANRLAACCWLHGWLLLYCLGRESMNLSWCSLRSSPLGPFGALILLGTRYFCWPAVGEDHQNAYK